MLHKEKCVDSKKILWTRERKTESNECRNLLIQINIKNPKVQILDETDYISHSTNTLGKGMNPIILPPAMGK